LDHAPCETYATHKRPRQSTVDEQLALEPPPVQCSPRRAPITIDAPRSQTKGRSAPRCEHGPAASGTYAAGNGAGSASVTKGTIRKQSWAGWTCTSPPGPRRAPDVPGSRQWPYPQCYVKRPTSLGMPFYTRKALMTPDLRPAVIPLVSDPHPSTYPTPARPQTYSNSVIATWSPPSRMSGTSASNFMGEDRPARARDRAADRAGAHRLAESRNRADRQQAILVSGRTLPDTP